MQCTEKDLRIAAALCARNFSTTGLMQCYLEARRAGWYKTARQIRHLRRFYHFVPAVLKRA